VVAVDREANVDGLLVSIAFEIAPPAGPAAVVARLAVDLPDGRALVAVELLGDEVAWLLAGETLALPGYVIASALVDEESGELVRSVPLDEPEPEPESEPGHRGQAVQLDEPPPDVEETPGPGTATYGSNFDDPPAGTEPIAGPAEVDPPHRVVAYIDGRWRDALVVSRKQRTALVAYAVEGPFGDRLRRLMFDRLRRFVVDGR
jgi:hypothetical protein